jgi:hypothetical protein
MSNEPDWNDEAREQIRGILRWVTLGELRLARNSHDDILSICRDVYLQDACPKDEWDEFLQFADKELHRNEALIASEQATWPKVTDCDRLDDVETDLRERGIVLWQVSPCCDTCTFSELPMRIDEIDKRFPGFRERVRGYAFFIDQNMPEVLSETREVSVFLAYGWLSSDGSKVADEIYQKNALGIAHEICDCLRDHGFEPDWDGKLSNKIGVRLNWQRRTMLT